MCLSSNILNLLKNHTKLMACYLHVYTMLSDTHALEVAFTFVGCSCHAYEQKLHVTVVIRLNKMSIPANCSF